VVAQTHDFYIITMPGLEDLCARELIALKNDIQILSTEKGGLLYRGRLESLYHANLHLRTAGRILWRIAQFKATNFRQLNKRTHQQQWAYYLPPGCLPALKVTAHQSRLYHSKAIEQSIEDAIRQYWHANDIVPLNNTDQTLFVRIEHDYVMLSLDSSGAPLYQRGIKSHGGQAPLRENIAAAILMLSGYDGKRPLIDPMCGAGTFSLEAALMAKSVAPGCFRKFAFEQWPALRRQQWQFLKKTALQDIQPLTQAMIFASDFDAEACGKLADSISGNHLTDAIDVRCTDFFDLKPPCRDGETIEPGLLVLNPPYGRRLSTGEDIQSFYRRVGLKLKTDFCGWQAAILIPHPQLAGTMPFEYRSIPIMHGGLNLTLIIGVIK